VLEVAIDDNVRDLIHDNYPPITSSEARSLFSLPPQCLVIPSTARDLVFFIAIGSPYGASGANDTALFTER